MCACTARHARQRAGRADDPRRQRVSRCAPVQLAHACGKAIESSNVSWAWTTMARWPLWWPRRPYRPRWCHRSPQRPKRVRSSRSRRPATPSPSHRQAAGAMVFGCADDRLRVISRRLPAARCRQCRIISSRRSGDRRRRRPHRACRLRRARRIAVRRRRSRAAPMTQARSFSPWVCASARRR